MYDSKSMLCSCRFCDARGFLLIPRVLIKTLQVGCGVHVATIALYRQDVRHLDIKD